MNCSCGGDNENCVYCGGLGEVKRPQAYPRIPRTKKSFRESPSLLPLLEKFGTQRDKVKARIESAAIAAVPRTKCPKCSFAGTRDQLYKHIRDSHPSLPEEPMPALREGMRCPFCVTAVLRAEFELHTSKVHRTSWEALEKMANAGLGSLYRLPCSLCESNPGIPDLFLHFEAHHNISEVAIRQFLSSGACPEPRGQRYRGVRARTGGNLDRRNPFSSGVQEPKREDLFEAHRNMGFVIRESGRYGSHPLHDRHDDESEP